MGSAALPILVRSGALRLLDLEHGPLFYVGWFHAYLLTFAGSVLLLATRLHLGRHHHRGTVLLAVGLAAPWLGNALYVLELAPGPALDYTNVGFAVTGIAFTVGHSSGSGCSTSSPSRERSCWTTSRTG